MRREKLYLQLPAAALQDVGHLASNLHGLRHKAALVRVIVRIANFLPAWWYFHRDPFVIIDVCACVPYWCRLAIYPESFLPANYMQAPLRGRRQVGRREKWIVVRRVCSKADSVPWAPLQPGQLPKLAGCACRAGCTAWRFGRSSHSRPPRTPRHDCRRGRRDDDGAVRDDCLLPATEALPLL